MRTLIATILGFLLVVTIAYGCFRLYRWFNWTFGYEDMVKQTITEMVKPECLRNK